LGGAGKTAKEQREVERLGQEGPPNRFAGMKHVNAAFGEEGIWSEDAALGYREFV
jgi:hypothetical protein